MSDQEQKDVLLRRIADLENEVHLLEGDLIHDPLTGLKTRAFFEEELDIYLSAIANVSTSRRKEWFGFKNLSVLFIDIDDFKKVNDTYGHPAGDTVLKEISRIINQTVREGDTVARWGGEEVVVSLLGADETDAKEKAEDIRKKVSKLSFSVMSDLQATVSIGVVNSESGLTSNDLISRADKALYRAKETGKNKVVMYSEL